MFVTHRLQDMDSYDKIIFVNGRTVEAVGTHSQLMTTNQAYQNMISKGVIE